MLLKKVPDSYKKRRQRLMKAHPGSVFILPSAPNHIRNSDVHHPYRQESNIVYLSGFEETDSCLVLAPSHSKAGDYRMILFVLPRDPDKEMWEGERYGLDRAQKVFEADEVYSIHELDKKLLDILHGAERIFYRLGLYPESDRQMLAVFEENRKRQGRTGKSLPPLEDPGSAIGELRLFKDSEEIEFLRRACQISAQAHFTAMKECRPGMNESEIEALVDYVIRKEGCQRLGYPSIIASGKNATCLHYRSNNEKNERGRPSAD